MLNTQMKGMLENSKLSILVVKYPLVYYWKQTVKTVSASITILKNKHNISHSCLNIWPNANNILIYS